LLFCRSQPAGDGGLTADQFPTEHTHSNCGSWLASDGGLTADQTPTENTRSHAGAAEGCDLLICFGFGFGFGFGS
jgi:hypothetical protein